MTNNTIRASSTGHVSAGASAGGSVGGVSQPGGPTIDPRDPTQVDFEKIVDVIEGRRASMPQASYPDSSKPWRREYTGKNRLLPRWILPGFGESYDDCGAPFELGCIKGHTHETTRTPGRNTCPFCAPVWARNRAINAVARLEAYKRYSWKKEAFDEMFLHHVVVSPGADYAVEADTRKDAFEEFADVTSTVLKELGAIAGFMAYHPWSGDHSDDEVEDDLGAWKDRLFEGRDWQDVLEELEFRPHMHAIVVAPFVHGGEITKKLEKETGTIVARIADEESNKSIDNDSLHSLASVVTYNISHTSLYENPNSVRSATRWFGIDDAQFREPSEHIQKAAEKAVHEVAPETLGLPEKEQVCHTDITEGGLDLELDIGDGPSSGGDTRGSTSSDWYSPSGWSLTEAGAGELPIDPPRDRGQLQDVDDSWSTPVPSEGRLKALKQASAKELISTYEGITKKNVWRVKNNIEELEVNEDLCGEPLKPVHTIIERLDDDPDLRREASALDELRENVTDLLDQEARDIRPIEAELERFRDRDFEDVDEVIEAGDQLREVIAEVDGLEELDHDVGTITLHPSFLEGVDDIQERIIDLVDDRLQDVGVVPNHLRPITRAIDNAGRWIMWEGPGDG